MAQGDRSAPPRATLRFTRTVLVVSGLFLFALAMMADSFGSGSSNGLGAMQGVGAAISMLLVLLGTLDRRGILSARVLLGCIAAGGTLILLECGYRCALRWRNPTVDSEPFSYRLSPDVITIYDRQHGLVHKPNHHWWQTFVVDGRPRLGTFNIRTNAEGFAGKRTISEYRQRQLKILVFGDSFTCWNQNEATWPDLFEQELASRLGQSVGVLNFGRAGYGVIQMLELAAASAGGLQPDLIIFAPINEDFARARRWTMELVDDHSIRMMLSIRNDEFHDYHFAVDQQMIDSRATPAWCQRLLDGTASPADEAVLAETNERFAAIRRESYQALCNSTGSDWLRCYLLERIKNGPEFQKEWLAPLRRRVEFNDYERDRGVVESIAQLQRLNIPMLFLYLPREDEVKNHEAALTAQQKCLLQSLERLAGQDFIFLCQQYGTTPPTKMDMRPIDQHPNYDGLKWYSTEITSRVADWVRQ